MSVEMLGYALGRMIEEANKIHQREVAKQEAQKQQLQQMMYQIQMNNIRLQQQAAYEKQIAQDRFNKQLALSMYQNTFQLAKQKEREINQQIQSFIQNPAFLELHPNAQQQALKSIKAGRIEEAIPVLAEGMKGYEKQREYANNRALAYKMFDKNILMRLPEDKAVIYNEALKNGDIDTLNMINNEFGRQQVEEEKQQQQMKQQEARQKMLMSFYDKFSKEIEKVFANENILKDEERQAFERALQNNDANTILALAGKIDSLAKDKQQLVNAFEMKKQEDFSKVQKAVSLFFQNDWSKFGQEELSYLDQLAKEDPHLYQLSFVATKIAKENKITPDKLTDFIHATFYNDKKALQTYGLTAKDLNDLDVAGSKLKLSPMQLKMYAGLGYTGDRKKVFIDMAKELSKQGAVTTFDVDKIADNLRHIVLNKTFKSPEEAIDYLSRIYVGGADGKQFGVVDFSQYIQPMMVNNPRYLAKIQKKSTKTEGKTTSTDEREYNKNTATRGVVQDIKTLPPEVYYKINPEIFNNGGMRYGIIELAKSFIPTMSYYEIDLGDYNNNGARPTGKTVIEARLENEIKTNPEKKEEVLNNVFGW